jgi:putative transposase
MHHRVMARLSRIIVPGLPHHVTQRGNRRQSLFTERADYALYRDLMAERCEANGVACWAYCLMPNHVHLILTPSSADGLSRAVGEAHRRFTAFVNARARTTGHLFQARFASFAMDDAHLLNAVRYLAFNPVRAGLAASPDSWPWASVAAHLKGRDDALVEVAPVLARARFADLLEMSPGEQAALEGFETRSRNGRPLGAPEFLAKIEKKLGRSVRPARPGRKPRKKRAR